ncbi:MAG: methylmalonyl-CoA mutase family protein, partial [Brooklawnia sp.]
VSPAKRGARQHAVTSWREITRDDPSVNILRATIATFSAAVGGAEAITVLPFDTVWGLPNDFSRRLARNTQIVLAEESNIGRVNDPAGGAWYIESLTRQIAEAAWAEFGKIEAAGGMVAALAAGTIAETLDDLNAKRAKLLATRKLPVTGVSEFPNPGEAPITDRTQRPSAPQYAGLKWARDAEPFEALRDATAGTEAKVFLACLGTRRDFGGREGFASNYFHIAGLATSQVEGGSTEQIVAAWQESGTPVACLCSSAKVYAVQGLEVATALKKAGAQQVLLAGNIKELGDVDSSGVIDGTIAMGMDVVAGLNGVLDTVGVTK